MADICPFCGLYPYEDVNIGIGMQHIAVNCCEYGDLLIAQGVPFEEVRSKFAAEHPGYARILQEPYRFDKAIEIVANLLEMLMGETNSLCGSNEDERGTS